MENSEVYLRMHSDSENFWFNSSVKSCVLNIMIIIALSILQTIFSQGSHSVLKELQRVVTLVRAGGKTRLIKI